MEKVVLIIPDNNKGKFISKGFSSAFKDLSYFVFEKKIHDLNIHEIINIKPDIIFIFWTNLIQKDIINDFLDNYFDDTTLIMHFAELKHDIPKIYYKKENNFIFSSDSTDKNFLYIPSADGKKYRTKFLKYHHNITFCGNPAFYNREKILSQIIMNFGGISIFCKSYDFYKSLDEIYKNGLLNNYHLELFRDSYKGYVESQQELAQIFISSKINIDMPAGGIKPYNYRCIEIMASGGFLITPFSNQLIKQFDDGKELETYNTESELIDKIAFYLENVNISRLIASKGKKNVLSSCSFYDRLKKGLKVIYDKNSCNR